MNPFSQELIDLLNTKYEQFNHFDFIPDDPVSIPHLFSKKEDIEIAGFFAAILAWGQRKTIINKCTELLQRMDNAPSQFITNHQAHDLKQLENFVHRTFNDTDLLFFVESLKNIYQHHGGLENVFSEQVKPADQNIEMGLIHFRKLFFSLPDSPKRTEKHISSPLKKSACKRINMYLRWMVRIDKRGVDFGIWNKIKPHQLVCPCDVHVERVAKKLKITSLEKPNWKMAVEITESLKQFDSKDPVKYDFALFGLGIEKYFDSSN